jgi:Tol biopolymer transport system component
MLNPMPTLYIGIPAGTQTVSPVSVQPTSPGLGTPAISPTAAATRRSVTATPKSYDGMILFKSDRAGKLALYAMNADGSAPMPLPDSNIYDEAVNRETLSPDGNERLRVLDNSGNYDIYVGPADEHKPPMAITSHAAADYDPAWSPLGDRIAFVSLRTDGKDAIFVMTPDGRNDHELTFSRGFLDKHPTWSPDESQLAFGSNRDGHRQIYVMNADGSGQKNISDNAYEDYDPVWLKH